MREVSLGEVVQCLGDIALPARDDRRPYIALEHLAQGEPRVLGHALAAEARSAKCAFAPDDILLGKLRPNLRKAALAPFAGVCSTDILVLRAGADALPRFVLAALHTDAFWSFAESSAVGTRMPRARWESLRRFRFALPDAPTQARAVEALGAFDRAVEANEQHLARLREARRALGASVARPTMR
ncbi:MAG: hypothetical protein U0325_15350 [Polyangiales bacterium]